MRVSQRFLNRPIQMQYAEKSEPFFAPMQASDTTEAKNPFFAPLTNVQTKLEVNAPGDQYEQEADAMAEKVVQRSEAPFKEEEHIQKMGMPKEEEDQVQRKCATCEEENPNIQRKTDGSSIAPSNVTQQIHNTKCIGNMLPAQTRSEMESFFGTDFSDVRIHDNSQSAEMNDSLQAHAFTHGSDIYFNQGKFAPESSEGKRLLAHELTHVVQQGGSNIKRTRIGTRFTHNRGATSPYRAITATFDGRDFVLYGDGTPLATFTAQSGRPYSVRPVDATACGGSTSDSYLNNPRYVGISDNGPIPEGTFSFNASQFATFSFTERSQMITGGSYTDPFGRSLHGGDWGSGRVPLSPRRILPGSRGCGNTSSRSGFYLHGGVMPGSSGCIDVGNSGIDNIITHLQGYRRNVIVTVSYPHSAPTVGALDRALGRFTYPSGENPGLLDRLNSVFSAE